MAKWRVISYSTFPMPDFTSPDYIEDDPKDYEPEVWEFTDYYEAYAAYLREQGKMTLEIACLEKVALEIWNDKRDKWAPLFESFCYHTFESYGL